MMFKDTSYVLPLIFVVACMFTGCKQKEKGEEAGIDQQYKGIGVVKAISASRTHINIDHEDIEGFMGAMQMFFPVRDTMIVNGIEPADSIQFVIQVQGGNYAISSIEKIE